MGVTAHFFAFDPAVYTQAPTMERWLEWDELDREMNVQDRAKTWLVPIESYLGDNKKWYEHLSVRSIWSDVRPRVADAEREPIDHLLSHFIDPLDLWTPCPCGLGPSTVAEGETIWDHALCQHIVSLRADLDPIELAIEHTLSERPELRDTVDRPYLWDFAFFEMLIKERRAILRRASKAGDGWSLLQWVWV